MIADDREVSCDAHHCEPKKAITLLTLEGILTLLIVVRTAFATVSKHHTPRIAPMGMQSAIPELGIPTESS